VKGLYEVSNNQFATVHHRDVQRLKVEQEEAVRLRRLLAEKADNLAETRVAISELKQTLFARQMELDRLRAQRAENPLDVSFSESVRSVVSLTLGRMKSS
jgi:hypothetical protein